MRPQKISREQLLQRCAVVFKDSGLHGTSMDALARACGLTKAAFYHHYPTKQALLADVLAHTHQQIRPYLFELAYDEQRSAAERLTAMNHKAERLFMDGPIGCLMGVIAVDAVGASPKLLTAVQAFFDEWAEALAHLYRSVAPAPQAELLGRQMVALYEGAILMARTYQDPQRIRQAGELALSWLATGPAERPGGVAVP